MKRLIYLILAVIIVASYEDRASFAVVEEKASSDDVINSVVMERLEASQEYQQYKLNKESQERAPVQIKVLAVPKEEELPSTRSKNDIIIGTGLVLAAIILCIYLHLLTKKEKAGAGFTLLEMAISLLILVIVITSLLLTVYRCLSIIQTSRDINIALSDMREVAERLRREVDTTGAIQSDSYTLPHINSERVVINAVVPNNPIPVRVTISWLEESQRQRSVTMDMLFIRRW